jgi:hypothetical protein
VQLNFYPSPAQAKRWLIIGLTVAAILVLLLAFRQSTQGTLILVVAPQGSHIATSTGHQLKDGSNTLSNGHYTIKISRAHFVSQTFTVNIKGRQTTTSRYALAVADAIGLQYYHDHPDQQALADGITGHKLEDQATQTAANYPILNVLPVSMRGWRIDYGQSKVHPTDGSKFALYITSADDSQKAQAQGWMKSNGYTLSDYEVVYQDVATYQAQLNNTTTPTPTTGSSSPSTDSNIDRN